MNPPRLRAPHHRVERRAIAWWAARALTFVLIIGAGLGAAHLWWDTSRSWTTPLLVTTLILGAVYAVVMPVWRYSVHRWEATENAVYHRSGWWVREWRAAPISRIQTVDTIRGPYAQLLGLATLAVTTASAHGAINIVGLDKKTAAEAAERLTEITQRTPGDQT